MFTLLIGHFKDADMVRFLSDVEDNLEKLHDEINAASAPQPHTRSSSASGLARLDRADAHDGDLARPGQEVDLSEDRRDEAQGFRRPKPTSSSSDRRILGKRTLVMIKSTLRRSIRQAQVHKLIGRNVVELIDLPAGTGHPSRAMTQAQAGKVLKTTSGRQPATSRW